MKAREGDQLRFYSRHVDRPDRHGHLGYARGARRRAAHRDGPVRFDPSGPAQPGTRVQASAAVVDISKPIIFVVSRRRASVEHPVAGSSAASIE